MFYWPSAASSINGTVSARYYNTTTPVTTVYGSATFTSPSVYFSIDRLQKIVTVNFYREYDEQGFLYSTGYALGGAGWVTTNSPLTISSLTIPGSMKFLGEIKTQEAASQLAFGGSDYHSWAVNQHNIQLYAATTPITWSDIETPRVDVYYLNPYAPGCNEGGSHPECSTIFDGAYKPLIAVPTQVRDLDPAFASCYFGPPQFGLSDPPSALTQATAVAGPEPGIAPGVSTSTVLPALPASTPVSPTAMATVSTPLVTSTSGVPIPSVSSSRPESTPQPVPPSSEGLAPSSTHTTPLGLDHSTQSDSLTSQHPASTVHSSPHGQDSQPPGSRISQAVSSTAHTDIVTPAHEGASTAYPIADGQDSTSSNVAVIVILSHTLTLSVPSSNHGGPSSPSTALSAAATAGATTHSGTADAAGV
ncbi:hypothetical protein LTR28_007068, partial [Elasticomyces elasticus]